MDGEICIRPVGVVRVEGGRHRIEIHPEFEDGLLGVAPGDRLQVLYWMHRLDEKDRRVLRCHPRGDRRRPLRGVFGLRSPMRPNPIGSTEVTVLEVDGRVLTVEGLDALDGSPVVDLKVAWWRDDSQAPAWWTDPPEPRQG